MFCKILIQSLFFKFFSLKNIENSSALGYFFPKTKLFFLYYILSSS
ncbi:hypothetical protein HMPREF6123_0287 [Oribacterium sinus F0268]|uniref:Uncharacterized protein n=1 Tax=Oribacterium sinus F0268 TaxID=585501 RepID=C2KUW8_9FIRM|nr:hypothetical protein HMPREF6123_0287 [Oribacterium sinus F0268]